MKIGVSYSHFIFFFFFQAEDGIRDLIVTGVQTCALPILSLAVPDVLVARAQAGDESALEALYRAFETPVYNLARRMLRRPEDAEDVLQETFLEVVRNIKQFRGEGHLWGWIRRIAATKALMRIRRDQVRATESLDEEPGK